MKIYTGKTISQFETNNYRVKTDSLKKSEDVSFQQDRITIGASRIELKEKAIVSHCTDKLVKEVRMSKSEEQLERLKQQVADGTYRPDAEKIAAKILLVN